MTHDDQYDASLLDEGSLKVRNYKYRFYPTQAQQEHFARVFGSCRYVWNKVLEQSIERHRLNKEDPTLHPKQDIGPYEFSRELTKMKKAPELEWLYDVSKGPLQNTVHTLGAAYVSFFKKRTGFPKFKPKHGKQSAYYDGGCFTLKHGKLRLSKVPDTLKLRGGKITAAQIYGCRVTKTPTGKYYLTVSALVPIKRKAGSGVVGIDLGIKDLAVLSTGEKVANPKHYVRAQQQLARAQRKLSRKKKGSNNRNKQRLRVARIHERIANCRKDHLHKLSSKIVHDNQAIVLESLNVKGMVKNHKLAKHVADAGWGVLKDMLIYKASESDVGMILLADTYYPSTQLCSDCGQRPELKLGLAVRKWTCPHCGSIHDRDINAAINLKQLGEQVLVKIQATPELSQQRLHQASRCS